MKWSGDPSDEAWLSWGLPPPKIEYRFHPTRRWRFDYAWPEVYVALEKQGGTWRRGGGAHRGVGFERDIEKFNEAQCLGWIVLQQTPEKIFTKESITLIAIASGLQKLRVKSGALSIGWE
jgi:hypothetical protein